MSHTIPPFNSQSDPGYKFLRVFDDYHLAREETINLYVEGGVSPYDWETDSNHLVLGSAQTVGQSNTIEALSTAVADLQEVITVTDAEGSQVEIIVCVCDEDCCVGSPDAFEFDDDSTDDYVDEDSCIDLYVAGGCAPYTWEITDSDGGNFSLTDEITDIPQNELCLSGDATCYVEVTVTDSCLSEAVFVIQGGEEFEFDEESTPDQVPPGGSINLYVMGGIPPYDWVITYGDGWSLDYAQTSGVVNVLNCAGGTCGVDFDVVCHIVITDSCGNEVYTVRASTTGKLQKIWIDLAYINHDEECGGVGDCKVLYSSYYYYTKYCPYYAIRYVVSTAQVQVCTGDPYDGDCCGDGMLCGYDSKTPPPPNKFLCGPFVEYDHDPCGLYIAGPFDGVQCSINIQQQHWICA